MNCPVRWHQNCEVRLGALMQYQKKKKIKKEVSQRRHIVSSSIEPFMFGSNKYCACYLQLLFFKFSYLSDLRWWEWNDAMTEWCRKHLASVIHECMVGEIWERQLSWLATMQAGNKTNQTKKQATAIFFRLRLLDTAFKGMHLCNELCMMMDFTVMGHKHKKPQVEQTFGQSTMHKWGTHKVFPNANISW